MPAYETFCSNIQMVGSELGINGMKAWIQPSFYKLVRLLVVVRIFSLLTLGPSVPNSHFFLNYLSAIVHHAYSYMTTVYHLGMYISHQLMAASSRITYCHKTQIISNWVLMMGSLYSNGLYNHQICIQQSIFGMRWNRRFTSLFDAIMSVWLGISEEKF